MSGKQNPGAHVAKHGLHSSRRRVPHMVCGALAFLHSCSKRCLEQRTCMREDRVAGNLCALNHNVVHSERSPGCFGEGTPEGPVPITVMLRSDAFRAARARKKNSTPGPKELFRIVNSVTAKHLAEEVFMLLTFSEVLSEA